MKDVVIVDGDALQFLPLFGNRLVMAAPAQIRSSGSRKINGKAVSVSGDEKKVRVNATYTTPTHPIPGSGIITISSLSNDQVARHSSSQMALIVKGQQFTAQFLPTQPATTTVPPGTPPDVTTPSTGKGMFISTQFKVKAD
ncbi:MAG: hypothetical protein K2Q15_13020 [Burkholderiales bacterium]|nr:hypothetical protein [Burkholderiales bacterium]